MERRPVEDGDPAVSGLDDAVALELAHHLGDGLAGRGDHVRQILVREAHVYEIVLAEAFAEVHEQRRQAGRDLPVQQALYDLVGLAQPLGERREQPEGELGVAFMTRSRAAFWMLATLASVTASANTSCQRPSTRLSLPKTPLSLRRAVVASL